MLRATRRISPALCGAARAMSTRMSCCADASQQQRRQMSLRVTVDGRELSLERVLVVTKTSRYEYEKYSHPELTDAQLAESLSARGAMYATLKLRHEIHQAYVTEMLDTLRRYGCDVQTIHAHEYEESCVEGAHTVLSAGGDGTFLLASSGITSADVPLIGINTDTERSHGHLCLSFPEKRPLRFEELLNRILRGEFRWLTRQRMRVTMIDNKTGRAQRLPKLALNEAIFCERDSARPTYYQLVTEDNYEKSHKHKSSGLLCCTGTGSTAWMLALRKIRGDDAAAMLDIMQEMLRERNVDIDLKDLDAKELAKRYNRRFVYNSDVPLIEYAAREPIENGIFASDNYYGFARKLSVQSRSMDAEIVVDGAVSYPWVDGDTAILEILPEDALTTVKF